jgi:hypothetical protein
VGVYGGQRLASAPVQLRIDRSSADGTLRFTPMDVVFVGADVVTLTNVDAERGIFEAEFLLSFRQRAGADGANVLFTNEAEIVEIGEPIIVREESGMRTEVYRFKGEFTSQFDFAKFPFDTQRLRTGIIHAGLGTGALQYALENTTGANDFTRTGNLGTSGEWQIAGFGMSTTASNIGRGIGSLSFLADDSFERSGFESTITLRRDRISAGFKNLFPILVVIIMLYSTLFLPTTALQERLTVAVSAILAVAFFSTGASNVARPGRLISIDLLFLTAYGLAFANLSLTVALNTERFQRWAGLANRFVLLLYPLAVGAAIAWFVL